MLESTNIFLWIQKQSFLTDRLSAFDRRRRRVAVANQRAGVTLNNRVGVRGLGYSGGRWRELA